MTRYDDWLTNQPEPSDFDEAISAWLDACPVPLGAHTRSRVDLIVDTERRLQESEP